MASFIPLCHCRGWSIFHATNGGWTDPFWRTHLAAYAPLGTLRPLLHISVVATLKSELEVPNTRIVQKSPLVARFCISSTNWVTGDLNPTMHHLQLSIAVCCWVCPYGWFIIMAPAWLTNGVSLLLGLPPLVDISLCFHKSWDIIFHWIKWGVGWPRWVDGFQSKIWFKTRQWMLPRISSMTICIRVG